jgi:argininosuccinate synthase
VRFEVALRTLNPDLTILAPVRDHTWARSDQLAYLQEHGLPKPPGGGEYSINRGLWGVTIGGRETLGSAESIPESAWVLSKTAFDSPREPARHVLGFEAGIPVSLDGKPMDSIALLEALESLGAAYGIGRGIHLGDTVLGTKGRVAFEAPAAEIVLTAHRELEKLTLTGAQQRLKDQVAAVYGELVHVGQHLDPACRDAEALLESSQARVSGVVNLLLRPGQVFVEGVASPHSLMAASRGAYGEAAGEWTAADAVGYSRLLSLPGMLYTRAA